MKFSFNITQSTSDASDYPANVLFGSFLRLVKLTGTEGIRVMADAWGWEEEQ